MKQKKWSFILVAVVGVILVYGIITYNGFVKKEEAVTKYWADVERTYQRRADLIPVLVQTVKGMAGYEKQTLERIAAARARLTTLQTGAPSPEIIKEQEALQTEIATQANTLIAVIESYPAIRGTEAFLGLQTQLEGTERRIKVARNDYNEAVNKFNVAVRTFPSSVVATMGGFTTRSGFAADAGTEKAVEIKF